MMSIFNKPPYRKKYNGYDGIYHDIIEIRYFARWHAT